MNMRGYFGIYSYDDLFQVSNYGSTIEDCINGIVYHLSGKTEYNIDIIQSQIDNNIVYQVYCSDFIKKRYRHFAFGYALFQKGIIYIFKYENGSLISKYKLKKDI